MIAYRRRRRRPDARRRHVRGRHRPKPRRPSRRPRRRAGRDRRHGGGGACPRSSPGCARPCPDLRPGRYHGRGGEGCRSGTTRREYLDFVAGIAVVGLGHSRAGPLRPPSARPALARLEPLLDASRCSGCRVSERFPGAVPSATRCRGQRGGLKIARKATGRTRIVALEAAFTGERSGRSRQPGSREVGASARSCPISFAWPNDVESLERLAPAGDTALLLLEPVLGEGGVTLEPAFAQAAAELRSRCGALLCVDEVQAGMGRTGTFFAHEQLGIIPIDHAGQGPRNGCPWARCSRASGRAWFAGRSRLDVRGQSVARRCRCGRRGDRRRPARRRRARGAARDRPRGDSRPCGGSGRGPWSGPSSTVPPARRRRSPRAGLLGPPRRPPLDAPLVVRADGSTGARDPGSVLAS